MAIYKYLSSERIDVLRDARVRFTQPNALNDPFELKPFFKTIFNMETFREKIRGRMDLRPAILEKYKELPGEILAMFTPDQFVQLAMDQMEANKDHFDAIFDSNMDEMIAAMPALSEKLRAVLHGKLGSGIGILSLSEDSANDLMWAHYAADHSGLVLEFDETNEFFHRQRSDKDEFFHLRKVNYIGKRLSFESFEQMIDDENELFASKLDSWAYEQEWRMLAPLMNRAPEIEAAEPIHLFQFPRAAVSAVIFGYKSSPAMREEVCSILKSDAAYADVNILVTYVDLEQGKIAKRPYL
ncbi:MAG: DUF2971 domain-containing protein [Pseudoxanthomonas sp.]